MNKSTTKLIRVLLVLIPLFYMQVASAGVKYFYGGVKRYYPSGNNVYLQIDITMMDPGSCGNQHYYAMSSDNPNFEDYKKILLTAKASGHKIGVYIYDNECVGLNPKIYRLFIQ